MMRLTTMLWLALAAMVVAGLFHLKYLVSDQEKVLAEIRRETARVKVETEALYAEWNRLNRPDRLRRLLNARHSLTPVAGGQLRAFAELPTNFHDQMLAGRRTERAADNKRTRRLVTGRRAVAARTRAARRTRKARRFGPELARRPSAPPGRHKRRR